MNDLTPRVSVAIMAHPKRRHFVGHLWRKLDRGATIVWDRRSDRWDTGRRALLSYRKGYDYHCVVQDDAVLPRDLIAGVERALTLVPAPPGDHTPLCLYTGRTTPFRDQLKQLGRSRQPPGWLRMSSVHWGVGLVLPTALIPDLVAWGDTNCDIANYDLRIGAWLEKQGIPVWYPFPSLVDHRNSPSLVQGRNSRGGRRAYRFIGQHASALNVEFRPSFVQVEPSVSSEV